MSYGQAGRAPQPPAMAGVGVPAPQGEASRCADPTGEDRPLTRRFCWP